MFPLLIGVPAVSRLRAYLADSNLEQHTQELGKGPKS